MTMQLIYQAYKLIKEPLIRLTRSSNNLFPKLYILYITVGISKFHQWYGI